MLRKVSAMEVRKNFGKLVNEVNIRNDLIVIERNGKPMAAIVPIWMIADYQKNRGEFTSFSDTPQNKDFNVSEEEIMGEILDAIREVKN